MNKLYSRIIWQNFPSENTALNESNLNRMDLGLDNLDNRVIEMDATKVNKEVANSLVQSWSMDESTGIITITHLDGSKDMFDLNIEKIPIDFKLSEDGILTMTTDDGSKFKANIGAMIPVLTFEDSDEIVVSVSGSGVNKTYSFSIKAGSVTEDKLQPNFLADIKAETAKAQSYKESAAGYASDAATSAQTASKKAYEAASSATSASNSKDLAAQSLSDVETARDNALTQINDALEANTPNFSVDLTTGHLMWQGGRFNFQVDNSTGHLGWEVSA